MAGGLEGGGGARTHKGEKESTGVRKITEYARTTKRGKSSEEAPG